MSDPRDLTLAFFAQQVLLGLSKDPVLAQLMNNSARFVDVTGAYKPGKTIDIFVAQGGTTTIKNDFNSNNTRTPAKGTLDQYSLTLNTLAITQLLWDEIDNVFGSSAVTNGTNGPVRSLIRKYLRDHIASIEKELYLNTFNIASLDGNKQGVANDPYTLDDMEDIRQILSEADWNGDISVILDPKGFTALRKSLRGSYTNFAPGDNAFRQAIQLADLPQMTVYESNNLSTLTEMTNITGVGTTKVGFAFAGDSTALFNPAIASNSRNIGVISTDVSAGGMNTNITSETDNSKELREDSDVMRTLFGSVVYRPTTVLPLIGGNIS